MGKVFPVFYGMVLASQAIIMPESNPTIGLGVRSAWESSISKQARQTEATRKPTASNPTQAANDSGNIPKGYNHGAR